jgi:hypothetical protein
MVNSEAHMVNVNTTSEICTVGCVQSLTKSNALPNQAALVQHKHQMRPITSSGKPLSGKPLVDNGRINVQHN